MLLNWVLRQFFLLLQKSRDFFAKRGTLVAIHFKRLPGRGE